MIRNECFNGPFSPHIYNKKTKENFLSLVLKKVDFNNIVQLLERRTNFNFSFIQLAIENKNAFTLKKKTR